MMIHCSSLSVLLLLTIDVTGTRVRLWFVISKMQSVWMISRSFLSCPLNCAIQRTLTLAWGWRRRNRRYYLYCHMDHMDGRDGWSHQHYQHPYQNRDHPSLQCERSPSWVERHQCWVWCKYYCKTTVLLEIHAGLAAAVALTTFLTRWLSESFSPTQLTLADDRFLGSQHAIPGSW